GTGRPEWCPRRAADALVGVRAPRRASDRAMPQRRESPRDEARGTERACARSGAPLLPRGSARAGPTEAPRQPPPAARSARRLGSAKDVARAALSGGAREHGFGGGRPPAGGAAAEDERVPAPHDA